MRYLYCLLLILLWPVSAVAAPSVTGSQASNGSSRHVITFQAADTSDSEAIRVGASCSVSVPVYGGAGTVQLWQVPTPTTAASSGTQVGSDITAVSTAVTKFTPVTTLVKAVASVASANTVMVIRCSDTDVASSEGGSGSRVDVEVDISAGGSAVCTAFNSAIDEYMVVGTSHNVVLRVHHEGVESVTVTPQTDYVTHNDGDTDTYRSCHVAHPMDLIGAGYPLPFADGSGGGSPSDALTVSLSNGTSIHVIYDNVKILVDQTGLTIPATFADYGNGWAGGPSYGALSQGFRVSGDLDVRNTTVNDGDRYDRRATHEGGETLRFSDASWATDTHVAFATAAAKNVDFSGLDVRYFNTDGNDIVCHHLEGWGKLPPRCGTYGYGEGTVQIMLGTQNFGAPQQGINMRALSHGIVAGSPKWGGNAVYSEDCLQEADTLDNDSANGADDAAECDPGKGTTGVRGFALQGGQNEGHRYEALLDFGFDRRNIIRDVYWESGASSGMAAGTIFKPFVCDAPSAGLFEADQYTPVVADETLDCLKRYEVNNFDDSSGTSCLISSDDVNFATEGVTSSDSVYIRGGNDNVGSGGTSSLNGTTVAISAVITGTGIGTGLVLGTGCGFTGNADVSHTHDRTYVQIVDSGSNTGSAAIPGGPVPDDGTTVISGRMFPYGSTFDQIGTPAVMIGENFVDTNRLMFTDGIIIGDHPTSNDMFTIHPQLTRSGRTGWTQGDSLATTVGTIDTSGAIAGASDMLFPFEFDGWYDAREEVAFVFSAIDSTWTDSGSAINSAGGSTECWNINEQVLKDSVGSGCDTDFAASWLATPQESFFTRAFVTTTYDAAKGFTTTEGCAFGVHSRQDTMDPGTGTTLQTVIHMPWEDGYTFDIGESHIYPLNFVNAPHNGITLEGGDGDFSASGTATCVGSNFNVYVELRRMMTNPFQGGN